MPIDRTWWNNLVDDDGSGTVGTIWNKAAIKGLLDAIDGMVEANKTFVPTLLFGGASAGMGYATRVGGYSRSDELIVIEIHITLSAKGTSTGLATIRGIPFNPKASISPVGIIDPANAFVGLAHQPIVVWAPPELYLMQAAATSRVPITDANFANNTDFNVSIAFRKA
jgi:hypothetical protein